MVFAVLIYCAGLGQWLAPSPVSAETRVRDPVEAYINCSSLLWYNLKTKKILWRCISCKFSSGSILKFLSLNALIANGLSILVRLLVLMRSLKVKDLGSLVEIEGMIMPKGVNFPYMGEEMPPRISTKDVMPDIAGREVGVRVVGHL